MAVKKTKKVTKITEIPEATVRIEVEQNEVESEEEVKEEENSTKESTESTKDTEDEKSEKEEDNDEEVKTNVESTESTEKSDDDEDKEKNEEKEEDNVENFDDENSGFFSWKKVFLFTVIAAVTGLVIVAVYMVFLGGYDLSISKEAEKQKSIEVEEEISATPTPDEIDKSAYNIEILNGSGIAGEAANVQELLENKDFKVSGIGNADDSNYLETQILFGEDVNEEYLDELQTTLETRGPVETKKADEDQTEDVVVIVGSELSEAEASPTPDLE